MAVADKKQFMEIIDGEPYLLRCWCTALAIRIYGSKALGLRDVDPRAVGASPPRVEPQSDEEDEAMLRRFLKAVMVKPRLAGVHEASDEANGVLALEDMGDDPYLIVQAVMRGREAAPGFTQPSTVQETAS